MSNGLLQLANDIIEGRKVLFITGAGLSVASGISTYRSSKNAIWNKFFISWGTRKKFQENPLEWWNNFWLRTHETPEFLNAKPNAGHIAISHITQHCNARIITQNIDSLHCITLNVPNRLIEVHGRLGLYKCIKKGCKYSYSESISNINLNELAIEGTSLQKGNLILKNPPLCPECGNPILAQSLLFDEDYESHSFYNWNRAQEWFLTHDIFVFVGTSFSVGVTSEALTIAKKYQKIIYNFNLVQENNMINITGPAEETLPSLYNYLFILAGKPRMYFYPLVDYSKKNNQQHQHHNSLTQYGLPPDIMSSRKDKKFYHSITSSNTTKKNLAFHYYFKENYYII